MHLVPGTSTLACPHLPRACPAPAADECAARSATHTQAPLHVVPMFSSWSTGQIRPPALQAGTKLNVQPRTHVFPLTRVPPDPAAKVSSTPSLFHGSPAARPHFYASRSPNRFLNGGRVLCVFLPGHPLLSSFAHQTLRQRPRLHRHIPHPPWAHPQVLISAHPVFLKIRASGDSMRSYTNMKGNYFFAELYW